MRIVLLGKFVFNELIRIIHPHAVVPVRFENKIVSRDVMMNILGFFVLSMGIFVLSVFIMALLGQDMPTSFGVVAASLYNIGPGLGTVGPTDNYAHLPAIAKWVLCFLMLIGRLELFTVMVLFSPSYWRK